MSKKGPVLRRSDINEMFDRSKLTIYDLLGISLDKDCSIDIHISEGTFFFRTVEDCEDKYCYKTHFQSENSVSYEEKTIKKEVANGKS